MKTCLVFLLLLATLLVGRAARESPRPVAARGVKSQRAPSIAAASANQTMRQRK